MGVFLPKIRTPPVPLHCSVILIYLLTTRRVPGYPLSYPVGYPGNELPDNGSPIYNQRFVSALIEQRVKIEYIYSMECLHCEIV